jgi:hypothetical protein
MRRSGSVLPAVLLAIVAAACSPAAPAGGPGATVAQALERLAAKDLEGLRELACEGQEAAIRDQLGLPDLVGDELLPGLDGQALLDAVRLDVSDVGLGEAAIDGDVAQVPVEGTLSVTFDAEAMRPILRRVLESQGQSMTDDQLDALLGTLEAYGQDVPVEQTIRLEREDGTWKICQGSLEPPPSS